jgi:hypothetical protein
MATTYVAKATIMPSCCDQAKLEISLYSDADILGNLEIYWKLNNYHGDINFCPFCGTALPNVDDINFVPSKPKQS